MKIKENNKNNHIKMKSKNNKLELIFTQYQGNNLAILKSSVQVDSPWANKQEGGEE